MREAVRGVVTAVCATAITGLGTWTFNIQQDVTAMSYSKASTKEVYSRLGKIDSGQASIAEALNNQSRILDRMDRRIERLEDRGNAK